MCGILESQRCSIFNVNYHGCTSVGLTTYLLDYGVRYFYIAVLPTVGGAEMLKADLLMLACPT